MNGAHSRSSWLRTWTAHIGRAILVLAILVLLHVQQQRVRSRQGSPPLANITLPQLQTIFPQATRLGEAGSHGKIAVLADDGRRLGYVIQTAPASDAFVGFSGSTNLVIGLLPDDRICGCLIQRSGDTRDHVELVAQDQQFLKAFIGRTWWEAAALDVDAVSGATLTSLSILQGLRARLGENPESLKFPEPLTLADAHAFFPAAQTLVVDDAYPAVWHVRDAGGRSLGRLLRTSPAADNIIGYQGPSDAYVAMHPDGHIIGVHLRHSYDNEPYVGYVRDDRYFGEVFHRYRLSELAELDLQAARVEGVSGATMTSIAMARGLVQAAHNYETFRKQQERQWQQVKSALRRGCGTLVVVAGALTLVFTPLRGRKWLRRCFQVVLIGYLGLTNGDLLSQAMLVGWAQNGIPWRNALGLVVLTAVAFSIPLATKHNVYCHHLCPHGAAQQLLRGRLRRGRSVPRWLARGLNSLRPLLLLWVLLVAFCEWPFSLVDIEPFDAYLWRSAGWATVAVAIAGLLAASLVPMAYCRHACPTGAVLDYVRRQGTSHRWRWADGLAVAYLALTAFLVWARW